MKIENLKKIFRINYPKVLYSKYKDSPVIKVFYTWRSNVSLKRLTQSSTLIPIQLDYINEVNQATHPDAFLSKKYQNQIVLTASGYPFGYEKYENQYVFTSEDGIHFRNVLGKSAVATYTGDGRSYYSDGEIIEFENRFYLFYRFCDVDHGSRTIKVFRTESDDLHKWHNERLILSDVGLKFISPSIVIQNGYFDLYYVEQIDGTENSILKRRRSYSLDFDTTEEEILVRNIPDGMMLWHIDIVLINGNYYGLFDFSTGSGGKGAKLYYAKTNDGGNSWTVHKEIELDVNYEFVSKIYRSTLVYHNKMLSLYVPVCTTNNCWFILMMQNVNMDQYE